MYRATYRLHMSVVVYESRVSFVILTELRGEFKYLRLTFIVQIYKYTTNMLKNLKSKIGMLIWSVWLFTFGKQTPYIH